jgi:hypothetical protein
LAPYRNWWYNRFIFHLKSKDFFYKFLISTF